MRFGLSFPNFGAYSEPAAMVELAVAAEGAGWDGFFVWDHIVISDGMPVADPWVLLGAIGQATGSISIGPMVGARVAAYVKRHRTTDDPFDVVVGGLVDGDMAAMRDAGVTWYLAGPSPSGESVDETLTWISSGPPS